MRRLEPVRPHYQLTTPVVTSLFMMALFTASGRKVNSILFTLLPFSSWLTMLMTLQHTYWPRRKYCCKRGNSAFWLSSISSFSNDCWFATCSTAFVNWSDISVIATTPRSWPGSETNISRSWIWEMHPKSTEPTVRRCLKVLSMIIRKQYSFCLCFFLPWMTSRQYCLTFSFSFPLLLHWLLCLCPSSCRPFSSFWPVPRLRRSWVSTWIANKQNVLHLMSLTVKAYFWEKVIGCLDRNFTTFQRRQDASATSREADFCSSGARQNGRSGARLLALVLIRGLSLFCSHSVERKLLTGRARLLLEFRIWAKNPQVWLLHLPGTRPNQKQESWIYDQYICKMIHPQVSSQVSRNICIL